MVAETPVMTQYRTAKQRYPDALLFFRMGDFYEMFFDDAKVASEALGLTLTARDRERKIPMAGVPVKAADGYLRRLLRQGHKVAVCEQTSDPKKSKGLVDRAVVRVLTPGTITEDDALDPRRSNYLLAIRLPGAKERKKRLGLAWIDLSTGRFFVAEPPPATLQDEIARIAPSEILLAESPEGEALAKTIEADFKIAVTHVPAWTIERDAAARVLKEHFAVASLRGFGLDRMPAALAAAGGALEYLKDTQLTSLGHVTRIEQHDAGGALLLERTTRRRLDLVQRTDGSTDATLVAVLDRTRTASGGRLLREWILAPLADKAAIEYRHDGVEEFVKDTFLRRDVAESLGAIRDIERILARVATGRANARDLQSLGRSLEVLPPLRGMLETVYSKTLSDVRDRVECFQDLCSHLARALLDELPAPISEGGLFRGQYNAELDELRSLSRNAKEWIAAYQAKESERTGIPKLKIGFNRVFGYYIEITHAHRDKVPDDYTRKQTLTNAERYVTPELDEYEGKILTADERAKEIELELFQALRAEVALKIVPLQAVAVALAELDVFCSLAEVASVSDYARPEMRDDRLLEIRDGRHPVVEANLAGGDRFVPNDTTLCSERRVGLITGPNMAGKSTYIRQNALIVLMAQMGSFVPAASARIGICDRIFTRVGAEDDLAGGQSTFMVEMSEAAYILNHATDRSLVVLDEVGRGTSTYDGIAIAWALTEYLSEVLGSRTLFATHYHELTQLSDELPAVHNLNVAVREWGESIVFLHRIQEGATDRSYGIHVARLAGVPDAVIERARAMLTSLEAARGEQVDRVAFGDPLATPKQDIQLGLFIPDAPHPVLDALESTDLDTLTPIEALNLLSKWKSKL